MGIHSAGRLPRFSGIYANWEPANSEQYLRAVSEQPDAYKLKPYATRLFGELQTTLAVTKLIGKDPCEVHILGCSDGSEAYAYAIAFSESLGEKIKNNTKINAVDDACAMVKMAQTGHLVCTNQEKVWANDPQKAPNHPLAGEGWGKYLKPSSAPSEFKALQTKYPYLAEMTRDPVAGIQIGKGMQWYKVKTEGLPAIDFKWMDMAQYVKTAFSEKKKQVYVVANSLADVLQQKGLPACLQFLQDIQNNNLGKDAYLVFGDAENHLLAQHPDWSAQLEKLFAHPVSKQVLGNLGVQQVDQVYGKIWKLNPVTCVKFNLSKLG